MTIPDFRDDGRLPEGVHLAAEAEVMVRLLPGMPQLRLLVFRFCRMSPFWK
jgi:hypothetical protein